MIENLTSDSRPYLLSKYDETLKKYILKMNLFQRSSFKIYQGTENNYIEVEDCVF